MNEWLNVGFIGVAAVYTAAAVVYWGNYRKGEGWHPRLCGAALGAAILGHAIVLGGVGWMYRQIPLVNIYNVLSFVALGLMGVYGIIEIRFRVRTTGVFVVAAALMLYLASWPQISFRSEASLRLQNPWFGVHVILAIIGYMAFTLSAIYGGLFLALYRSIKRKAFGLNFQRLPPLDLLSKMNAHSALFGLGCLTGSILMGIVLSIQLNVPFKDDPTFIQSLFVWGVYGVYELLGLIYRWRGPRQVYGSLVCFAAAAVSLGFVLIHYRTFHP